MCGKGKKDCLVYCLVYTRSYLVKVLTWSALVSRSPQVPGLVRAWVQASRELLCRPVTLHTALGVRPPILGSSGIVVSHWSSPSLNSSWLCISRNLLGMQLNNLAPSIWRVCSLSDWIAFLPFLWSFGIWHFLPSLPSSVEISIPQFGTFFSKIFQT